MLADTQLVGSFGGALTYREDQAEEFARLLAVSSIGEAAARESGVQAPTALVERMLDQVRSRLLAEEDLRRRAVEDRRRRTAEDGVGYTSYTDVIPVVYGRGLYVGSSPRFEEPHEGAWYMAELLTSRGVVFWPVGTGDSSTIVVDEDTVMQVDLNDMAKAADDDTAEVAVVDRLIESLPIGADGRPHLAGFVLTHADLDHCRGFPDLLSEVTIGELWVTPRLWRDLESGGCQLSESAKAVQEEAERRVAAVKDAVAQGKDVVSGDRVLVIGYDTDHDKHTYSGLPKECFAYPGEVVTMIDGVDCAGRFEAFLHAPFKDDCAGERNETSIAMQVTLTEGSGTGKVLLFGDLSHDTIMKIWDITTDNQQVDRLAWDVLLAPHHCSKSVMYVDDERRQDILDALETAAKPGACVVSSSQPIPDADEPGANPPHRKAADRYAEIATFYCTMEHGSTDAPTPIVFEVDASGIRLLDPELVEAAARSVEKAFTAAPSRLGRVAAAAARYAREKSVASPAWRRRGTRPAGADRIGQVIIRDRGGQAGPTTPVGFGAR